nr:uncharacterized protein LOC117991987 [Maniola hyperantus]
MKTIVCLFALVAVCLAGPEKYTDRYDNIDLDEILANRRLLVPYLKCILEEGKCSPEGKELKMHIKEALENNCGNCTDAQKNGTKKVIAHLINKEKEYWNQLCAKYDPERKYVSMYEKELKEVAAWYKLQGGLSTSIYLFQFIFCYTIQMKPIIIASLCLISFVVAKPAEHYTDKFDGIDVKEVLANRRLLLPYVKCILDQGKCSPEGKELKSHIKEAVENYCGKCTDVQRSATRTVIAHLINHESDYWNQLTAKYDPDRKYTKKYEKELKAAKQ